MEYLLMCIIFSITIVSGKHCTKHCTTDSDCNHDHVCRTDDTACHSWCIDLKHDVPPPVIGKRTIGCYQLPMICPQRCMVTKGGCTMCDCSKATAGSGSLSASTGQITGQIFPFNMRLPFGNSGQMGQFGSQPGKINPGNMGSYSGGSNLPNGPNSVVDPSHAGYAIPGFHFNPGNPGGSILAGGSSGQTQNGGTKLDQILMTTSTKSPSSTLQSTSVSGTCAPVRCIAPCDKGISMDVNGCPVCLCH